MTLLRSGSATDTGLVRSTNQDLALESTSLFAVADGMGGHAGGEVASRMAVDALQAAFGRQPTGPGLSAAVSSANEAVWRHSQDNPDLRGMGTTLTAAALVDEGGRDVLALVNVGDSRSYRFHDGELTQITTDHSLAEEMVESGELTRAEAAVHPHRHILTRALGVAPEVDVDLWRIRPARGDRFLLCSDGLTNELGNGQIAEVLGSVADPGEAADLLVRAARSHGGSDNITVVVIDVVMGDDGDVGAPAVVAVTDGFADPDAAGPDGSGAGVDGDGASHPPAAVPEAPAPGRRARRLARRRARRRARGRRLVTVRTFLFVVLLAAIVVGAFGAVRWYDTNSYYVGLNGNELVIFQGRVGGVLWYHPVAVDRTGVTVADVPATYVPALRAGVQESSVGAARTYVHNLVAARGGAHVPAPTLPAAPAAPAAPTTTAAG